MNFSPAARVKRYSAKTVEHLADRLFDGVTAAKQHRVVDPFCGSGEILLAAQRIGVPSAGFDVNPYAALLAQVRLERFSSQDANELVQELLRRFPTHTAKMPLRIDNAQYWFPEMALDVLGRLKSLAAEMRLHETASGRSLLLAIVQSIRLVSFADNRSPKPYISKSAKAQKLGVYRDPLWFAVVMHAAICEAFGGQSTAEVESSLWLADSTDIDAWRFTQGRFTHAITSPPYINAQDYFRNFKFEIGFLADLVPEFEASISAKFIGRERGLRETAIAELGIEAVTVIDELNARLRAIRHDFPKSGAIVYRYFCDMRQVFSALSESLEKVSEIRLICSDSVVRGHSIPTGDILCELLRPHGFRLKDRFDDSIRVRYLAPKRAGHEALMRAETIYRLKRG